MELPVHDPNHLPIRSIEDARAMGAAIQENLVRLAEADSHLRGIRAEEHDIRVPGPARVTRFAKTLLSPEAISNSKPHELHLQLHEAWGQYCLMLWLFHVSDAPATAAFDVAATEADMRCESSLEAKRDEVHAIYWKILRETRRRADASWALSEACMQHAATAGTIPATVFGEAVETAADELVLIAAREHAGMLRVLRWVMDRRREWADPGLAVVGEAAFPTI